MFYVNPNYISHKIMHVVSLWLGDYPAIAEFSSDLVYKFKRIVGKPNFSDQFKN